jgi:hypothetical protein
LKYIVSGDYLCITNYNKNQRYKIISSYYSSKYKLAKKFNPDDDIYEIFFGKIINNYLLKYQFNGEKRFGIPLEDEYKEIILNSNKFMNNVFTLNNLVITKQNIIIKHLV